VDREKLKRLLGELQRELETTRASQKALGRRSRDRRSARERQLLEDLRQDIEKYMSVQGAAPADHEPLLQRLQETLEVFEGTHLTLTRLVERAIEILVGAGL
jgi:hypothetical protein